MNSKLLLTLVGLLAAGSLSAQTLIYNFTGAATGAASGSIPNVVFSTATSNNNFGTVATPVNSTSASNGYSGASGTNNLGAAARIGALDVSLSAYFEFTLTPSSGFMLTLNSLAFGERSTGTGPQLLTILTSLDNFSANLSTAAVANDSTWRLISPTFASVAGAVDQSITIRVYGSNGAGNPTSGTINFRADDISIGATATAIPEPSAVALGVIGLAGMMALVRRRN